MAAYDGPDCLSRLVDTLQLLATREEPTSAQLYTLLTNACRRIQQILATHCPWSQVGAPIKLTTSDLGYTYVFASYPLGLAELRESRTGEVLLPCSDWDVASNGFIWEGQTIRWPNKRARTFADGPYARYVARHGIVDATTAPTLKPDEAIQAAIYDAAVEWATQGGLRDPTPYKDSRRTQLWGDPEHEGNIALIPMLKQQAFGQGGLASTTQGVRWWTGLGWVGA